MEAKRRVTVEELFIAVLSDPDFKSTMSLSFMKHMELLLKVIEKEQYSLIRYSVQVFTSEDMARDLILNQEVFDRTLCLLELFMALSAYQEREQDISAKTYDAIWNASINFKYLFGKPANAEIAVNQTDTIPRFVRAFARGYKYNAVVPI